MIRSLIAASLALSTAVAPVQASTFTEMDLLNYFEEVGGRVYFDSQLCKESPAYGLMVGGNTIHICTAAHKGDTEELKDTIRHEVWHVVQACKGGPISQDPIQAIVKANAQGWTGQGYKPETWHFEAEAHLAAALLSAEQIKNAIDNTCL